LDPKNTVPGVETEVSTPGTDDSFITTSLRFAKRNRRFVFAFSERATDDLEAKNTVPGVEAEAPTPGTDELFIPPARSLQT
jgi:hypothetical protein